MVSGGKRAPGEAERGRYYTQGYAGDIAVVVRAMDANTASSLAQDALRKVGRWCREVGLSVNPENTEMVIFTRKRKLDGWNDPLFQGRQIRRKEVVKHLRITLDAKLNWGPQMERISRKACAILSATRRACGITWGLTPRMLHWLYTAVVKPVFLHGAVVWWGRTRQKTALDKLLHTQRLACRGIIGAMQTTPSMALEMLLNLPPLHLEVKGAAATATYRGGGYLGVPGGGGNGWENFRGRDTLI